MLYHSTAKAWLSHFSSSACRAFSSGAAAFSCHYWLNRPASNFRCTKRNLSLQSTHYQVAFMNNNSYFMAFHSWPRQSIAKPNQSLSRLERSVTSRHPPKRCTAIHAVGRTPLAQLVAISYHSTHLCIKRSRSNICGYIFIYVCVCVCVYT